MFWSQKRIWLADPALAGICSPSGQPSFASTQQIFSKKSTALSICCLSFDVRVGS
jgi:hypothetical protein